MEILSKRPLVAFCISMVSGILLSDAAGSLIIISALIVFVAAVLFAFLEKTKCSRNIVAGILLFFALGAFEYYFADLTIREKFTDFHGTSAQITGTVSSVIEQSEAKTSCIVNVEIIEAEGKPEKRKGKILLNTTGSIEIKYGDRLMFSGTVKLPSRVRNPGGFDYKRYLTGKGVSATVFAVNDSIHKVNENKGFSLKAAGINVRKSIADVIEASLPPQQAGLLNGMLTGYTEGLSEDVKNAFSDSGLSHIMAVSGANVAFIVIPVIYLLKLFRVVKRASNIVVILFLVFFVYVTGFEPSVLRSVIMAVTVLLGKIIRRDGDIYTTIAFSAILLLCLSPHMLFNIGFQLSYTATLSLVLFSKPLQAMLTSKYIPGFITDTLAVTLAAQAGVLPVTVMYFNKVSTVSLVSNLLAVPVLEIITILGMAMAALGHIYIGFAQVIGYVNCTLLSFVLYITGTSAAISFSTIKIATPGILLIILYYIALWFFLYYRPLRKIELKKLNPAYYAAFASAVAVGLIITIFTPGRLEIVFLDVGQGDSVLVRSYKGSTVLIDGGGKPGPEGDRVGTSVVIPFLLDMGITGLDAVVATHGHDDHIKGIEAVLRELKVNTLIIPALGQHNTAPGQHDEFNALLDIANKRNVEVKACSDGDIIKLDDKTFFEVLSPDYGFSPDKASLNDSSLVLKLNYGNITALFTGDISSEKELSLINEGKDLDADILKIAHHGSSYSSCEEFIAAVSPEAAVICVGSNNFGHPGVKVLNRLEDMGVIITRTDRDGAVIFTTDGKKLRMHTTIQEEIAQ